MLVPIIKIPFLYGLSNMVNHQAEKEIHYKIPLMNSLDNLDKFWMQRSNDTSGRDWYRPEELGLYGMNSGARYRQKHQDYPLKWVFLRAWIYEVGSDDTGNVMVVFRKCYNNKN